MTRPATAAHPALNLLAAALFSALVVGAFTAPWSPNSSTVPTTYQGRSEYFARLDAGLWTYLLAWGAQSPGRWYDPPILVPLEGAAHANDPRLLEGAWSIPFFRFLEPVTAWGWTMLAGAWMTAFSAWWSGRRLTGSNWGGAAAAVLFAAGSFRAAHTCHVEAICAPFLPLLPAMLASLLDAPSDRRAWMAGGVLGLAAIDYSYTAVALALTVPAAIVVLVAAKRMSARHAGIVLLAAGGIVAAGYGPIVPGYAAFHAASGLGRSLREVDTGSADLWAWLTGPNGRLLPPFGPTGSYLPDLRLFPGFAATIAGIAGLFVFLRRRPELALLAVLGVFWSLGTGRQLAWTLGLPGVPWPLPYELFYDLLLPLRAIRAPARLAVVAHLALVFAGVLLVARLAARGRRGRLAAAVLLLVAFAEARQGMHEVTVRTARVEDPVYGWVRSQAGEHAVLDLPLQMLSSFSDGAATEAESQLASLLHGKPTPNGTMAMLVPWHEALAVHLQRPRSSGVSPGVTRSLLRALGVRWVIARDETSAVSMAAIGLAERWVSPTGSRVFLVEDPLTVPRTPGELQERMAPWMPRVPDPRDTDGWRGEVEPPPRIVVEARQPYWMRVTVRNTGTETWTVRGALYGLGPSGDIEVASRGAWTSLAGTPDQGSLEDGRGRLFRWAGPILADVAPGESAPAMLAGYAPPHRGRYRVTLGVEARGLFRFPPAPGGSAGVVEVEVR